MADLPSIQPDYTVSKKIEPRVLKANLGDGYVQRAADGINTMKEHWSLTWTDRPSSEIDTLETFFITHAGYISFDWVSLRSSASKKYICINWSRSYSNYDNDTLTAIIEEVFDY